MKAQRTKLLPALLAAAVGFAVAAQAGEYKKTLVAPGSNFHGVHGITVAPDGMIYTGSVVGASVYSVDPKSGAVQTVIGPPIGMADDLEFGPNGELAYTSFLTGIMRLRLPDGSIKELGSGLPGINSTAWKQDGRLFATQVFLGDALYEMDPTGAKPPRKIIEKMGGLNGFDFGPDGMLYGPLWFKGQVAKVNVDTGELAVVADGFKTPAAANFDSKGNLYVVDTALGQVVRVDPKTGDKTVVANVAPSIDNLAFGPDDTLYITNMAKAAVYRIDVKTGQSSTVTEGTLAMPSGIAAWSENGKDTIYIADLFAFRTVDASSGAVDTKALMHDVSRRLEYPMSARVGDKHVVLSSWFSGAVQKLDRKTGAHVAMWHGFAAPCDAVELPDGSMVVAELGKGQLTWAASEKEEDRKVIAKDLKAPVGLALAGAGAVYLSELAGAVSRIDLKTGAKQVIAEGLAQPEGIDVSDGKIIVAEVGKQRVVAIDPANGATEVIASDLPIGLPGVAGMPPMYIPTGIAAGSNGVIYVSSDLENAIYMLTPQ